MKALVIYDNTGRIWNILYGEEKIPQGLPAIFVDIPDGAILEKIDTTDSENPKPVFSYLPESDIGKIQKQILTLTTRLDEVAPEDKIPETLDEWKTAKKKEVGNVCEQTIYAGVDVELSDGSTEHFSLLERDQLNLFGKQVQMASGITQLEYHTDGQACRYYSAEDMQLIITAAMSFVSYHTTYCNALNMWIAGCETIEEVQSIEYGVAVPDTYQSEVLKAYLAAETK